ADDNDPIKVFEWRERGIEMIERLRQTVFGLDGVHPGLPNPSSIAPPQFRRGPCERQFIRHWLLHPRAPVPLAPDTVRTYKNPKWPSHPVIPGAISWPSPRYS